MAHLLYAAPLALPLLGDLGRRHQPSDNVEKATELWRPGIHAELPMRKEQVEALWVDAVMKINEVKAAAWFQKHLVVPPVDVVQPKEMRPKRKRERDTRARPPKGQAAGLLRPSGETSIDEQQSILAAP